MSYLNEQLCLHLYIKTRVITRFHEKRLREQLNLTYPNALVLLKLDEQKVCFVEEISKQLCLDTGTLTPLLKKLQVKGYIDRQRSLEDERRVCLNLTTQGQQSIKSIKEIFSQTSECLNLSSDTKQQFLTLLKSINLKDKTK